MGLDDDQSAFNQAVERRFTVHEAARVLGITPEAVRGRLQRGTLLKEKGDDGTVYVRLTADQMQLISNQTSNESQLIGNESSDQAPQAESVLVEALKERIEHLSQIIATRDEEIRRRDAIIMTMAQRIPELEPASEQRESPVTASEEEGKGDVSREPEAELRPWWRRLFSG
jgi:hypothetical protein